MWGAHEEYVSSPKLDDLQCTYANLQGFLQGGHPDTASVYAVFDNEEVGSGTKQGAGGAPCCWTPWSASTKPWAGSHEDYLAALASSFMVSADNAHAVHPGPSGRGGPDEPPPT